MLVVAGIELNKPDLIVRSALTLAAAQGVSRMTLRDVAAAGGVSLGLVQHYFGTKAALVEAVNEHVLNVCARVLDGYAHTPGPDAALAGFTQLVTDHPEAMDYVARAVCENEPVGAVIFDRLLEVSAGSTSDATAHGTEDCVADPLFAAINPMVLGLGTIALRRHIERNLRHTLDAPEQMARWGNAVTSLIGEGYFHRNTG